MPSDPRATLTAACSWSVAGRARPPVCVTVRARGSWKAPASARGFPLDKRLRGIRRPGDNNGVEADARAVAVREERTPEHPGSASHPIPRDQPPEPVQSEAPSSLRFWLTAGLVLAALGALDTLAQLPMWRDSPALATVNVLMSLAFILTGLLLRR